MPDVVSDGTSYVSSVSAITHGPSRYVLRKMKPKAESRHREALAGRSRCQHVDLELGRGMVTSGRFSSTGRFSRSSVRRARKALMCGVAKRNTQSGRVQPTTLSDIATQAMPKSREGRPSDRRAMREKTSSNEDRAVTASLAKRVPGAATTRGTAEWPKDHARAPRRIWGRGTVLGRLGGRFNLAYANVADRIGVSRNKFRQLLSLPSPHAHAQDFSLTADSDIDPFNRGRFVWSVGRRRLQATPFVVVG